MVSIVNGLYLVNSLMVANILNQTGLDRRSLPALRLHDVAQVRETGVLLKLLSSSEQPWGFLVLLRTHRMTAVTIMWQV